MTRSTDQLITIFNKLSTPVSPISIVYIHTLAVSVRHIIEMQHFAMSRVDLTRAPVPVDPTVIHTLRAQLHTFKKCFSGKEFVEQFLKLGREAEMLRLQASSEPSTPSPQIAMQRSPGGGHAYNSTGTKIYYTVHYAKEVGQFLLSERVLLPLPNLHHGSSVYDSDEAAEDPVSSTRLHESSSIQTDQRVRLVDAREGGGGRGGLAVENHLKEDSPQLPRTRRSVLDYRTGIQEDEDASVKLVSDIFVYSPQSLYKFSDVEDFESRTLYHSLILSASAHPHAASGMEETTAFERARMGMLFLVQDLLQQRARKDKMIKQFLQTPRALEVADRRKRQYVDCNLIFKM